LQRPQHDGFRLGSAHPASRADMVGDERRPDGGSTSLALVADRWECCQTHRFISPLCTDACSLTAPETVSR
jgi:hypothetical protein